jgi:hypothetical protein
MAWLGLGWLGIGDGRWGPWVPPVGLRRAENGLRGGIDLEGGASWADPREGGARAAGERRKA